MTAPGGTQFAAPMCIAMAALIMRDAHSH